MKTPAQITPGGPSDSPYGSTSSDTPEMVAARRMTVVPSAVDLWNLHANDLVRHSYTLHEAEKTFRALDKPALAERARKLSCYTEIVLAELAGRAGREDRRRRQS